MSKSGKEPDTGKGIAKGGDVSFIRATGPDSSNASFNTPSSTPSITSSESLQQVQHHSRSVSQSSGHSNHSSHSKHVAHELAALQPHLYHGKHQQQRERDQHYQPHSSIQPLHHHSTPYLPDHMMDVPQQYHLKFSPSSSPHYGAGGGASGEHLGVGRSHTDGWSEREEALSAELEEAKIRVAQMEKTMRWWSDCTSNWREKWNKASKERNKAKDENRILRAEVTRLRRERKEALAMQEKEPKDLVVPSTSSVKDSNSNPQSCGQISEQLSTTGDKSNGEKSNEKLSDLSEKERSVMASTVEKEASDIIEDVIDASSPPSSAATQTSLSRQVESSDLRAEIDKLSAEKFELEEKMLHLQEEISQIQLQSSHDSENAVVMQRKLDEANNTIQAERLEKCSHMRTVELLQTQIRSLQARLEEEANSKQDLTTQLNKAKAEHQGEIDRMALDLEDEAGSRSIMDQTVSELRRDLECLQADNAMEWAKREKLESEKLTLERDNKKLKSQISDLEEQLEKRSQVSSSIADSDIKTLQFELTETQKELQDVRHSHVKLRKALSERNTELEHTRRRAEQYQEEVKKLRTRVEDLKKDLAAAEDEVDKQTNGARKAQRNSDELQAQVDSLEVQVNHLQARLRSSNKLGPVSMPRSTSLKSLILDDTADLHDSENDDV